ncbi:hypothetical protein HRbin15_00360 [bacterium HR15]|nr:hypothetical protein HRbin15_00360 [bacterium HR15]
MGVAFSGGYCPLKGMKVVNRQRATLSQRWIAQEIANTFQLPLLSVPVQMAANAFVQLARYQRGRSERIQRLPPHLWRAVREAACQFCLQTLAELIGLDQGPDAVEPSLMQLYDAFLERVRTYMETPVPELTEQEPSLSPAERLRYEQSLWRSARDALELCEKWRRALSQHEVPEDGAGGASSGDLHASGKTQSQPHACKQRAATRR